MAWKLHRKGIHMAKRWQPEDVQIAASVVTEEVMNQLLDEAAEVIYGYFCQLRQEEPAVPETLTKRTGSDG